MALTLTKLGERLREARVNAGLTQEEAAEAVGLPRTSLLQIEAGNRSISTLELVDLARLYYRDIMLLLAEEEPEEIEPLVALCRVQPDFADDPDVRKQICRYLEIFREGVELERRLGGAMQAVAPAYELPEPRNLAQAIEQGEALAVQERKRLNLGSGSIADIAEVISSQGIWAAASKLPDDLSGLFLHQPETIGMAILVNSSHARGRRRFSYAHEYAHALAYRKGVSASVTSKRNASALTEKRANAFAGEFLMPAKGIQEILTRLRKGGGSRETMWFWDVANESGEHTEKRNAPGSQTISYQDVAYLANEFMVSYDAVVYRLSDMGAIGRPDVEGLLAKKQEGREFMKVLKLLDPDDKDTDEQPRLESQIGRLAVEALRREFISGGRLLDICEKLGVDGQRLLALAQITP